MDCDHWTQEKEADSTISSLIPTGTVSLTRLARRNSPSHKVGHLGLMEVYITSAGVLMPKNNGIKKKFKMDLKVRAYNASSSGG